MGHPAQPPAQAGSPTVGCTGPRPGGAGISPEKETPQPPWAAWASYRDRYSYRVFFLFFFFFLFFNISFVGDPGARAEGTGKEAMRKVKNLSFFPDIQKEKIQINFSLKTEGRRNLVFVCSQSFITKKIKDFAHEIGVGVAFGEADPEELHFFVRPGAESVQLFGEGDLNTSTIDFPDLRPACVFWRKKKGIFTGPWLSRAGAVGYTVLKLQTVFC